MSRLRETAQAVVDDAQVVSSADRIIVPQYVVSCDVLDALRSALAEPEWIPVTERAPEKQGRYVAASVEGEFSSVGTAYYYAADGTWSDFFCKITHWREWPEPPGERQ